MVPEIAEHCAELVNALAELLPTLKVESEAIRETLEAAGGFMPGRAFAFANELLNKIRYDLRTDPTFNRRDILDCREKSRVVAAVAMKETKTKKERDRIRKVRDGADDCFQWTMQLFDQMEIWYPKAQSGQFDHSAPNPSPPALKGIEQAILNILRNAGRKMITEEIIAALEKIGEGSEGTTKKYLAEMVKKKLIANDNDKQGYYIPG